MAVTTSSQPEAGPSRPITVAFRQPKTSTFFDPASSDDDDADEQPTPTPSQPVSNPSSASKKRKGKEVNGNGNESGAAQGKKRQDELYSHEAKRKRAELAERLWEGRQALPFYMGEWASFCCDKGLIPSQRAETDPRGDHAERHNHRESFTLRFFRVPFLACMTSLFGLGRLGRPVFVEKSCVALEAACLIYTLDCSPKS